MLFNSAPPLAPLPAPLPAPLRPAPCALAELSSGEHARLVAVDPGQCISRRLTCLGFTPGVDIHMLQNYGRGPLVVTVRGTRVALGRGEARQITVQRSAPC